MGSMRVRAGLAAAAAGLLTVGVAVVGVGAAETTTAVGVFCEPTPLGPQSLDIPTTIDAPDEAVAGEQIVVSSSTGLPTIVANTFFITTADSVWQLPPEVSVDNLTFSGGNSGQINPGGQWTPTFIIGPTDQEILDLNPWFFGGTSNGQPVASAVPEGWEPNENTVLVHFLPDSPDGFNGRPSTPTIHFELTVNEDVEEDIFINFTPALDSHSIANTPFGSTNTHCPPDNPDEVINAIAVGNPTPTTTTTITPETTTTTTAPPPPTTQAPATTRAPAPVTTAQTPRYTG